MPLKFGLFVPPFAELAEPSGVVELARAAEGSGWDGFFLWDHILAVPGMAVADSWVTMAAVAQSTTRIRLGMLVTPLARRRPWVLARQAVTLDRLSRGRLIVGVGLGDDSIGEFSSFRGEVSDPVQRGAMLDESLELLRRFWSGQEVAWEGQYFSVHSGPFLPRPVQGPLPVWVACRWPHRRPLARAARHQGCFPLFDRGGWDIPAFPEPAAVLAARSELSEYGAAAGFDIACRGASTSVEEVERADRLAALEAVGMTWWLESFGPDEPLMRALEDAVRGGPPRAGVPPGR
jgi:alkanesulfonate monooxygenase SsuD/methylene tetrahydromethanopterin reductase-like flavin-dependent oxidoreductase (luciferase family)